MEKSPKKWSLGSILFRKNKKDIPQADFSSDEDDRKAGFGNDFDKKSPSKGKTNKNLVQNFDQQQYSVANPEFHYFKPSPQQFLRPSQVYANQNNLELVNNQKNIEKNRVNQPQFIYSNNCNYNQYQGSSQDEKSSYNSLSSPINKNGSETGSRTSLNKRSRTARNERYYQRIMREDGRPLTVYGSVNSIENQKYQPPLNGTQNRLSASLKSSSLCSSDFMLPLGQQTQVFPSSQQHHSLPIPRYRGNPEEDKDDYENIHEVDDSLPPPIPPRDPNRRLSINSTSVSQQPYYFDHALQKYVIFNTNGKCFSDDKLWKNDSEMQRPSSVKAADKYDVKQHDILRPRSRKPLNLNTNLDNECVFSSEDVVDNPRYPISQSKRSKSAIDFEKTMNEVPTSRNRFTNRHRNLTSVEPIKYQPQHQTQQFDDLQALRKKYSSAEDVNKNKMNSILRPPTANSINTPGSRKSFNAMDLRVGNGNVSSNLDDAINELELMYKSLVKDENLMDRAERRDLPTPTKFSMMMKKYEEYENEENKNDKEPDIVLDDVFSRNLKHANQMLKASDPLPFGIPNTKLCPIPPKPSQDYLSVEPIQTRKSIIVAQNNPDLIADDLAVRNLRKDNPNFNRRRNLIEIDNNHFMKRNHTLSSLSEQIYNGILKDSAKPSGGKLEDFLHIDPVKKDEKSTLYLVNKTKNVEPQARREAEFEESLNALVIESKAISQKLEKDLSRLKRESVTPSRSKTIVNLLDFRKSAEREKEKKTISTSPIKLAQKPPEEIQKPKVTMTSTACSPIKDFEIAPPAENIVKSQVPKLQKAEKIGNLIKMFDTTTISPEPLKKTAPVKIIEKSTRKISDLSGMFSKSTESEAKPPTQPSHAGIKKTMSNEEKHATPTRIISPKIVSPTKMTLRIVSPKVLSPKIQSPVETPSKTQIDVESNINNIKELIEQIKQTEFEKSQRNAVKPDILLPAKDDLPDYDNIKDDYEMTDGRLERKEKPAPKPDFLEPLRVAVPKESPDDTSAESKSITTTSSSMRETSVESTSKDSTKSERFDESTAIYKDAIEFLHKTAEAKATTEVESEHKSPIKSIRQDKDAVLNYIDKINENLVAVKKSEEREEKPKMSVKESVTKLECKITLSRQDSEASDASFHTTKQSSPPVQIRPVILPKVGPSDTESLYNSSEELSMIFGGMSEQQSASVPVKPDATLLELEQTLRDTTAKYAANPYNNSQKCNC